MMLTGECGVWMRA